MAAGDEDDFSKLFPPPKELPADVDVERFDDLAGLRRREGELRADGWEKTLSQPVYDDAKLKRERLRALTVRWSKEGVTKTLIWSP